MEIWFCSCNKNWLVSSAFVVDCIIRSCAGGNADYAMDMHQKEQLHDNTVSMMQSQHFSVSSKLYKLKCVWVIDNLWWGGTHQDWRKFNYFLCKQFKPLNRLMTSCHESNKWKYEKFDPTISHENGWVLINNVGVANNHRVFLVDAMCYVS